MTSSKQMTPGQRETHVRWLTHLLEHYSGEEITLRARLDKREVWGDGYENEWRRYQAEAAALRAAIETLSAPASDETSAVTGWISVKEHMPPPHQNVLCLNSDGRHFEGRPCYGMHEPFFTIPHGDGNVSNTAPRWINVTHWMPLPAKPGSPEEPRETSCRYEAAVGMVCTKCGRIHDFGSERCAECQTPRLCGVERECLRNRYVRPAVEPRETKPPLGQEPWRCSLPVITVQMLADFGQEGFFEKTDRPVHGVAGVEWSQAAVDFACLIQERRAEEPSPRRCHCGKFTMHADMAIITDTHGHDHVFDGTSCDCEDELACSAIGPVKAKCAIDKTCLEYPRCRCGAVKDSAPCSYCFGDKTVSMSDGSKRMCELCGGTGRVEVKASGPYDSAGRLREDWPLDSNGKPLARRHDPNCQYVTESGCPPCDCGAENGKG